MNAPLLLEYVRMPAFHPPSTEACRSSGPAAADTSAPTLKWPDIKSFILCSFMMNIRRSVLFPPICGPQLMPETENGAGAPHFPSLVRQVAPPVPCSPPTTNAPFTSFGITATHFAPSRTCFGTPLSGAAPLIYSTVSVAFCSSEGPPLLFSSVSEVLSLCAHTAQAHHHDAKRTCRFICDPLAPSMSAVSVEGRPVTSAYRRACREVSRGTMRCYSTKTRAARPTIARDSDPRSLPVNAVSADPIRSVRRVPERFGMRSVL